MPASSRLRRIGDAVRQSFATYRTALSDRNVALLVGAGFLSEIGDWFNMVALIALAYRFADTAEGVGGLLVVRMVARLLLQGPAGAFVDRHAGRKLLFASQIVMALVAVSFLLLVRWPSLFLLNGLIFLAVALAVTQLRGGLAGNPPTEQGAIEHASAALEAAGPAPTGYGWLLRRRDLTAYTLVCLLLALLVQATITLFVIQAIRLDLGDSGVGVFYASVAAGSLAGSVAGGARGNAPAALVASVVAMAICAAALAVFGAAGSIIVALAALAIAGFATDFYEVVGLAYFQDAIPGQVYGRFFSLFLLALSAGGLGGRWALLRWRARGALGAPALESRWGLAAALGILALPTGALAVVFGFAARHWEQRRPEVS